MLARVQGKGKTQSLSMGVQTGKVAMEFSVEVPQKAENRSTQDLAVPILGIYPKDLGWLVICQPDTS